jgi:hypothetical protein
VCFNAFKYDGNDEIYGLIALAVAQQATVRRNSAFWRDKGGDGGRVYYVYEEDNDRQLHENSAAPDYRHTLGIEPKTWLSRNYQEVMRLDFDNRKLQLKPDKEGDPVLANHVQIFNEVRSSLLFCSTMAELSTILFMEIHRRLGYFAKSLSKELGVKWVGAYKKLVSMMKGTASYLYRLTIESDRCIEVLCLILDNVSDSVDRVPSALEKMLPNIYDAMKNKVPPFLSDGAADLSNSIVRVLCVSALKIEGHHISVDLGINDANFPGNGKYLFFYR